MTFLSTFDKLDGPAGNELLYQWIKYRRDELFEELRVARPSLAFWSHHPGNPDVPGESGPGAASLLTRREDVEHALANYSMRPYVLRGLFLLSEDEPDVHGRLRDALGDSFRVPDCAAMLDEAIRGAWREHVPDDGTGGTPVTLDLRRFARDASQAFARRFFGLPDSPDAPDRLEAWSELGYERFIWKLHARHFVPEAPDPDNEALSEINELVVARWKDPIEGTVIERLRAHVDAERGLTHERLIANVIGAHQGLVDNVMTGACYALNELVGAGKMDTVRLLARADRLDLVRSMVHEAHRADTPSPFLPRRLLAPAPDSSEREGESPPPPSAHLVCAIGSALGDPSADVDTAGDAWDLRLGFGRHVCLGKRIGDDLMVRIVAAVSELEGIEVAEPLQKRWGWIVSAFSVKGVPPAPDASSAPSTSGAPGA